MKNFSAKAFNIYDFKNIFRAITILSLLFFSACTKSGGDEVALTIDDLREKSFYTDSPSSIKSHVSLSLSQSFLDSILPNFNVNDFSEVTLTDPLSFFTQDILNDTFTIVFNNKNSYRFNDKKKTSFVIELTLGSPGYLQLNQANFLKYYNTLEQGTPLDKIYFLGFDEKEVTKDFKNTQEAHKVLTPLPSLNLHDKVFGNTLTLGVADFDKTEKSKLTDIVLKSSGDTINVRSMYMGSHHTIKRNFPFGIKDILAEEEAIMNNTNPVGTYFFTFVDHYKNSLKENDRLVFFIEGDMNAIGNGSENIPALTEENFLNKKTYKYKNIISLYEEEYRKVFPQRDSLCTDDHKIDIEMYLPHTNIDPGYMAALKKLFEQTMFKGCNISIQAGL